MQQHGVAERCYTFAWWGGSRADARRGRRMRTPIARARVGSRGSYAVLYPRVMELVSRSRKTPIGSHPATFNAVTVGGLRELVADEEILFARKFTRETIVLGAAGRGTKVGGGARNMGAAFDAVLGHLILEREVRGRGTGSSN